MANNTTKRKHRSAPDIADERIIETSELTRRIPLDRATLWRMSREGRFPKPIQLTRSRIGWRWSAILAWLAEREANPTEARQYFGRDDKKSAS
jgi:prophage regulatory protein